MDKKVVKNFIFNLIYQALTLMLPLVTTPYISRCLGVENIGAFSFTNSIVSYFVLFITFSFTTYGQKQIAFVRDDEAKRSQIFFEIQIKKLVLFVIAVIGYGILIFTSKEYRECYWIQIILLIAVLFDISFFFQGIEQYKITVIRNLVVKILGVVLIFSLVRDYSDLYLYISIYCATTLIGNLTLWPYIFKYVRFSYIKNISMSRDLKELVELFIPVLSVQMYISIDKTMLGMICESTIENGYYEQALKIVRVCQVIITSLGAVLISSISRMISDKDYDNVRSTVYGAIKFGTLLACAMTFGLLAVSDNLVPWFFGAGYEKVAIIISILSPIVTLSALSNVAGNGILIPMGKHNYLTLATTITAGVNIILNAIFIPRYYAAGAAMATVISEIVVLILQYYYAKEYLNFKGIFIAFIKYVFAGCVMLFGLTYLDKVVGNSISDFWTTIVMMIVGALIYTIVLVFEKDEFLLKFWKKLVGRKND